MELIIKDDQLKTVVEQILVEMLQQLRGEFYDLVLEVLEDVALANAIRHGRKNKFVDEDRIMALLEK